VSQIAEEIDIEVIVAKLPQEEYIVGYGTQNIKFEVGTESHDPSGFVFELAGLDVTDANNSIAGVDISVFLPGEYTVVLRSNTFTDLEDTATLIVVKVEFVYAEGENEGEVIEADLGVFTPCSGVNAGVPIYDTPDTCLSFDFENLSTNSLDDVDLEYFYSCTNLTETGNDTLVFTNAGFTLTVFDSLLNDSNVLELARVSVTDFSSGITNAQYNCWETSASSLSFENEPTGIIISLSDLNSNIVDTMAIDICSMQGDFSFNLTETLSKSCCFQTTGISASILAASTLTPNADSLHLALSDFGLYSNTVFAVTETGSQTKIFKNFDDPVPTSLSDIEVPDFLAWKVKIHGFSDPEKVSSLVLSTSVHEYEAMTFTANTFSLISDQKFIIVPEDVTLEDVPSGYEIIKIDAVQIDWTDEDAEDLTLSFEEYAFLNISGCTKTKKVQPDAVVLQSLPWKHRVGQGLDPENRIRKPYIAMGYSAIRDYNASVSDTLNKYIKGKQLWYSMSHGGLADGTPYSQFNGLAFVDGGITKTQLEPLDLNYRLVVADACCSAHSSQVSVYEARTSSTLTQKARDFADCFGPDVGYMGWGWMMTPIAAQIWSSEFVNNLKFVDDLGRGRTIQEAHSVFLGNHTNDNDARLMKVYGNVNVNIEKRME
jgi:hypothetical protein